MTTYSDDFTGIGSASVDGRTSGNITWSASGATGDGSDDVEFSGNGDYCGFGTDSSDFDITVNLHSNNAGNRLYIYGRADSISSPSNAYAVLIRENDNRAVLRRRVSGSWTTIVTDIFSGDPSVSHKYRFVGSGTSLKVYRDDVEIIDETDANITTGSNIVLAHVTYNTPGYTFEDISAETSSGVTYVNMDSSISSSSTLNAILSKYVGIDSSISSSSALSAVLSSHISFDSNIVSFSALNAVLSSYIGLDLSVASFSALSAELSVATYVDMDSSISSALILNADLSSLIGVDTSIDSVSALSAILSNYSELRTSIDSVSALSVDLSSLISVDSSISSISTLSAELYIELIIANNFCSIEPSNGLLYDLSAVNSTLMPLAVSNSNLTTISVKDGD